MYDGGTTTQKRVYVYGWRVIIICIRYNGKRERRSKNSEIMRCIFWMMEDGSIINIVDACYHSSHFQNTKNPFKYYGSLCITTCTILYKIVYKNKEIDFFISTFHTVSIIHHYHQFFLPSSLLLKSFFMYKYLNFFLYFWYIFHTQWVCMWVFIYGEFLCTVHVINIECDARHVKMFFLLFISSPRHSRTQAF